MQCLIKEQLLLEERCWEVDRTSNQHPHIIDLVSHPGWRPTRLSHHLYVETHQIIIWWRYVRIPTSMLVSDDEERR